MASSNLNYSASKYTASSSSAAASVNSSNLKQTASFSTNSSKQQNDDLKAKNWSLNQMRMNQSLKEFINSIKKSTTDANLDITNLEEDDASVMYNSSTYPSKQDGSNQSIQDENVEEDNEEKTLNSNSTTAEFKKYLEDLKKNYLEKLTFSCPSKLAHSTSAYNNTSYISNANNKNSNNIFNSKLKSVENINYMDVRQPSATPFTSLATNSSHTRRSLFLDSANINEENQFFDDEKQLQLKTQFFQKKIAPLNEKTTSQETTEEVIKTEKMFETPELTKTQILSRLVQIREYLKQSYAMLSTLQTSNDLMNYASQMNKLHSLIDHLKEQEKGYLDLLNSFSKFQQLTTNLFPMEAEFNSSTNSNSNPNINQYQKDILDLTDLNESLQQQQKQHQQQQNQILKEHAGYLNGLMSSANKSVAIQTNMTSVNNNNKNNNNNNSTASNRTYSKRNEDSVANSLTGSFISDTLTLNGINSDMNGLYKLNKSKTVELEKNDNLNDLIVIGKGYSQMKNDDDENRTENDMDLLEYEDENNDTSNNEEKEASDLNESNVREQRREILNALDSDMLTLEQLKEQKKLLKSIRLRKEELKALEGRRKALEALRQIAMDGESHIDNVLTKNTHKSIRTIENSKNIDSDSNIEPDRPSSSKNHLVKRKTFKQTDKAKDSDDDMETESFKSIHSLTHNKIEPSSQIEKSKKTVKHYEDLIKHKNSSVQNSLVKTVSMSSSYLNSNDADDENNEDIPETKDKNDTSVNSKANTSIKEELNKKIIDLAENEKKLEELYSMQSRLAQLKEIIVDFNGLKPEQNQLPSNQEGFRPYKAQEETSNIADDDYNEDNDDCDDLRNYEITQKYFDSLKLKHTASNLVDLVDISSKPRINYTDESEDEKELNAANREQLIEHKTKLADAKEKLKQLQDLIVKLKSVSSSKLSNQMTPSQQHKLEQKEASAALELLNEIEKQKQQDRLDELKRNKQKLLELLKQKETESAELARLYTSHTSQKSFNDSRSNDDRVESTVAKPTEPVPASSSSLQRTTDFVYPLELNTELDAAENDLEMMLNSKTSENHHSPSDLLWNQMKKQLNMRENLRNKKNELEELIRDENSSDRTEIEFKSILNPATASRSNFGQNTLPDENNSNKIINGYRDFFLKNKSNIKKLTTPNEDNDDEQQHQKYFDETDEEEIIMKRYVPSVAKQNNTTYMSEKKSAIQQQNVCSADELIKDNYDTNDFDSCDDDDDDDQAEEEREDGHKNKEYENEEEDEDEDQSDYEADENINGKKTKQSDKLENVFAKYVDKNHRKKSSRQSDNQIDETHILNSLNTKFNDLIMNQQQLNESIQRNFSKLLSNSKPDTLEHQHEEKRRTSNNAYLMASQFQFQTQMQVQQLMFNLNAAYHEIATQRSEMAQLNDQMKTINTRLIELTNHRSTVTTGTNTHDPNDYEVKQRNSSLITTTNALPSYFYNRRQTTTFTSPIKEKKNTNSASAVFSRLNSNISSESDVKKQYKNYPSMTCSSDQNSQVETDYQTKQLNKFLKQQQQQHHQHQQMQNAASFYNSYESYLSKLEKMQETCNIAKSSASNTNPPLTTQHSRHEVYYTDDFEDCEEEEEEELQEKNNKAIRSRASSNASSTKTNRSDDTTTATNITVRTNSSLSSNLALKKSKNPKQSLVAAATSENGTPYWIEEKKPNESSYREQQFQQANSKISDQCVMSMSQQQVTGVLQHDGELFSFDRMREKIYSEVATLISQNEARPFFLLNLFRELQYLKDKNARDQALKSIFNINNRNSQLLFTKKTDTNDLALKAKPAKQLNNNQEDLLENDDDDLTSFSYRMKKSEHIYRETTDQSSCNETSRTQSPFENDSLSNTVIFVKSSPQHQQPLQQQQEQLTKQPLKIRYPISSKKEENDFSRSSSSSIMGIQESTNVSKQAFDKFLLDQNKIETEVKNFISKLIKSIKLSDSNADYYDEEDDCELNDQLNDEDDDDDHISLDDELMNNSATKSLASKFHKNASNSYKYARCDSDYLNEIIDKVLNVLKQSNDHYDYLRLYQNQLSSYLKEALNKYENKRLIKCMEDILIDISDILYNELTFYSIMNHTMKISGGVTAATPTEATDSAKQSLMATKPSRLISKNIDIPCTMYGYNLEQHKEHLKQNTNSLTGDLTTTGNKLNLNLIKSLARKNNGKLDEKKSFNSYETNPTTTSNEEEDDENNGEESSVASFQIKSNLNQESSSKDTSSSTSSSHSGSSSNSDCSSSSSSSSSSGGCTSRTNSIADATAPYTNEDTIYYFDENAVKTKLNSLIKSDKSVLSNKIDSNYSEILDRLKFILNEKSNELMAKSNNDDNQGDDEAETDVASTSVENTESKLVSDFASVADTTSKSLNEPQVSSSVDIKEAELPKEESKEKSIEENEIRIEDLPEKLIVPIEKEVELNTLDKIIMESISDDLVGDADILPAPQTHFNVTSSPTDGNKSSEEENESQHSQKSENSDQFVMISETSNISSDDHDQVLVEQVNETNQNDQSVTISENTTITDLNQTN